MRLAISCYDKSSGFETIDNRGQLQAKLIRQINTLLNIWKKYIMNLELFVTNCRYLWDGHIFIVWLLRILSMQKAAARWAMT